MFSSKSQYDCRNANEDLHRILDGEKLDTPTLYERHMKSCSQCRVNHRAAVKLLSGLRKLPSPIVPDTLLDRIHQAVITDQVTTTLKAPSRSVLIPFAVAATVIIAIGSIFWGITASNELIVRSEVVTTTKSNFATKNGSSRLKDRMNAAGSALLSLTKKATEGSVDQTIPSLPIMSMFADRSVPAVNSPKDPLDQLRTGASTSVQPIASSARRAFELFRREIVPKSDSTKSKS
jgi:hypothetical protein